MPLQAMKQSPICAEEQVLSAPGTRDQSRRIRKACRLDLHEPELFALEIELDEQPLQQCVDRLWRHS